MVAAIILWNTVYMERAVHALRAAGQEVPNELLAYMSPLGWQHNNLTGDYIWAGGSLHDEAGLRPLRTTMEPIAA